MAYEIVWTDNINEDIEDILVYLESVASHKVAENFLNELREKVSVLTKFPESGLRSLSCALNVGTDKLPKSCTLVH